MTSVPIAGCPPVGPEPSTFTCPHCQKTQTTRMETEPSMKTHLMALLLCICGCCLCVPCVYCSDSCLGKNHYCGSCGQFLGKYEN